MFRSQATRLAQSSAARLSSRSYATGPLPGQPAPKIKEKSSNGWTYAAVGAAAVAGAYWYFNNPEDVNALKAQAKADEVEMKRKARESFDASKARAEDAKKQGQAKYDDVKSAGQDKLASARSSVDGTMNEIGSRVRQVGTEAEQKYDSYKDAAQRSLSNARDSTENLYNDARGTAERKSADARAEAERKGQEAKEGWFSWLGWGKSKADEQKRAGAAKVADAAEDVRKKANDHA